MSENRPTTGVSKAQSKISYEVDPYDNYNVPPKKGNAGRPQTAFVSFEEILAKQEQEAKKKAELRARRTDDPNNYLRKHNFNKHRDRVRTATPIVDSSCPIVGRNLYSSPTAFNRKIANFTRIERENAILVRRIAAILEGNGCIDNKLKTVTRNINNRGKARQEKLLKQTFENLTLLKRIQEQKPTYSRAKDLKDYERNEAIMSRLSYYPLHWKIVQPKGWEKLEKRAFENATVNPRPLVFFDCGTDVESLGRIVIELRADVVPLTVENFRSLCTGETSNGISYKCTEFNRVIPGILWQGGDVTGMKGFGTKSIYGDKFPDENFKLKHDGPGTVSMANYGPNTNGCQFIIDSRPLPVLDGVNVVVGKVIGGLHVLHKMTNLVGPTGKTRSVIWIYNCGQLESADEIESEPEDNDYGERPVSAAAQYGELTETETEDEGEA